MKRKVLLAVLLIVGMCVVGCGSESEAEQKEPDNMEEQQPEEEIAPEPNSSAMVDAIVLQAKADVQEAAEEDIDAALSFIKDNYPDYYTDNATMEKVIYYGSLIEYYYKDVDDTKYSLGMDAVQAVKYVYRNAETVEDEATQENLRQIQESLDALD